MGEYKGDWCAVRSTRLLAVRKPVPKAHGMGYVTAARLPEIHRMRSYKTLIAWKRAHEALLLTLRATDAAYHPRAKNLFDQLRRATISIEANIVEGYALNTPGLCRRHLRIAIGSAAEAECLGRATAELGYLDPDTARSMLDTFDSCLGALHGLLRSPPVTAD